MKNFAKNLFGRLCKIAWRQVAVVLAGVVAGYFLLDWVVMPLYTRQYQAISVPNVVFQSLDEAEKVLHQLGLRLVKDGEKFDETLPAGKIIFQNPEAFATVKKGRRIYVTLSKGGRTFEMPKLIGLALRDARFIMHDNDLLAGSVLYRRDPFLPEGVVCDQSIVPGSTVGVQSRVDITVSIGVEPTEFIVPNLMGKSEEDALLELQKAGLIPGTVQRQATEELLPNTVISQSLEAGLKVAKGDTVHLVVSVLP